MDRSCKLLLLTFLLLLPELTEGGALRRMPLLLPHCLRVRWRLTSHQPARQILGLLCNLPTCGSGGGMVKGERE
jgi:hypothetical protein